MSDALHTVEILSSMMTFSVWTTLMTERLRHAFGSLSVLDRDPGVCYVLGISAIDMVELIGNRVMLVPHKDPLKMIDGDLYSRHKGMTLKRVQYDLNDENFVKAWYFIRSHLSPESDGYEVFYEEE
jgi:hypothetical protein